MLNIWTVKGEASDYREAILGLVRVTNLPLLSDDNIWLSEMLPGVRTISDYGLYRHKIYSDLKRRLCVGQGGGWGRIRNCAFCFWYNSCITGLNCILFLQSRNLLCQKKHNTVLVACEHCPYVYIWMFWILASIPIMSSEKCRDSFSGDTLWQSCPSPKGETV